MRYMIHIKFQLIPMPVIYMPIIFIKEITVTVLFFNTPLISMDNLLEALYLYILGYINTA
jgi:hypothetical protein